MATDTPTPENYIPSTVWWEKGHADGWKAHDKGEDASACPPAGTKPAKYTDGWRDGWASARLRKMGRIASPNGKAWDEWEALCRTWAKMLTSRSGESKTLYGKAALRKA